MSINGQETYFRSRWWSSLLCNLLFKHLAGEEKGDDDARGKRA
jgi:hypothetical protein